MSCRESRAGSALTTIARLGSGLSDVQTLSAFHQLRSEVGRDVEGPSEEVYHQFLREQIDAVEADEALTDARRRSLISRLEGAFDQRPDGRTFHALQRIQMRTAMQAQMLDSRVASIARGLQIEESEVRTRLNEIIDSTPRTRRGAVPEGYTEEMGSAFRASGMPSDPATIMAVRTMEARSLRAAADRALAGPQRIRRASIGSGLIAEAGYDPDGGRLELVFRGRDGENSRVYAYRGVPQAVWERFQTGAGSSTYNTYIRGNARYRYGTQEEADLDSAARRCADCGQFAAAGHHCPPRIAREEQAAAAARAAEEAAERARNEALAAAERERARADEAAAQAAAAEARPPVRTAREAGIWGNGRWRRVGGSGVNRHDSVLLQRVTQLRAEAQSGPIRAQAYVNFQWRHAETDGLPQGGGYVYGTAVFDRPARGQYTVTDPDLQCNCPTYRRNRDCPHINAALEQIRASWAPASTGTRGPRTEADIARAQERAEAALRADWMRREETAAEAARSWAPSAPEDTYSTRFEAFEDDVNAALQRKADGEPPIPYQTSNVLGGQFTRESGQGFGVELEFDLPPGVDRYAALAAIGRDLHAAGLTQSERQQGYHASERRGYVDTHAGGWSYEQDCTVSGEIVSPIMYDEPETWENIAKVCEIVKRHGGVANVKTGSHVHVSSPNTTTGTATELLRMVNQHEDVIYRLSQNPERGKHRPMRWCGPNTEVPSEGYATVDSARWANHSHGLGLNMQSVSGRDSDHPEIRHWDGTMDPAVIQTQIKISTAMVRAAQRIGAEGGSPLRRREPIGTHKTRLAAVRGRSRRALTSEELKDDSATTRSFIDTLFTRREDKAQVAALFAVTKWN